MRQQSSEDRKRLREEAIVDFSRKLISRRDFMGRITAVGVSIAAAGRIADALAAPAPAPSVSRWSKQAEVTITFIKGPHIANDPQIWQQLKKEFEASHPGIKLNPTFFKWETMDAELTAGYASDSPPDSVYLVDLVLAKYVAAGQVADLSKWTNDPSYATEKANIAPFTWDVTKIDNGQRGVGSLGAAFGIFYNVDLFDKAGIKEFPQTRDALVEVAKALTTPAVWGFQVRDRFPDYAFWDWLPYVHDDGGDVLKPDLSAQNLDPAAAAATQYLSDMKLKYKVSPAAGTYDWNSQKALFEAGRIAILHDEYPQAAVWDLSQPVSFKLDVAQAPATTEGGKQTTMGNFGYATISEKSKYKDAAWEFVKWWTSKEIINPYAAAVGLQGVRIDSTPPYKSKLLEKVQKLYVPKVQGVQMHVNYYQMLTELWPEVEKAYRGQQSGADAMKKTGQIVNGLVKTS